MQAGGCVIWAREGKRAERTEPSEGPRRMSRVRMNGIAVEGWRVGYSVVGEDPRARGGIRGELGGGGEE